MKKNLFKKYIQMLDHSRCHGGVNKLSSCQTKQQNTFSSVTVAVCQPPWRGQRWLTHCPPPGVALGQTTPSPTVMSTALAENVTSLTVTPVILSSTTPGCGAFNLSTCEPCAPGSQYDNSESQIHHTALYFMFDCSYHIDKNAGNTFFFF